MTLVEIDAVGSDGEGIGRLDGKAVFVAGAMPGDVAEVEIVMSKKRFARGLLTALARPSPDRIPMPCRHAAECGGCTWQMAPRDLQAAWKQAAVEAALGRIGRFDSVDVRPVETPGPDFGYRNRLDLHPSPAGPGFHRPASHDLVVLAECLLGAPAVAALLDDVLGRPAESDLTLRAGLRTGEAVIIGEGHARPQDAIITEIVTGIRFQITGRAFFQPNTDGAETLVRLVAEAAGSGTTLVDVFAGVGLFGATVGADFADVIAIEFSRTAVADLRRNLPEGRVLAMPALPGLQALDAGADVVIVDPPRTGLGPETVDALVAFGPPVLVSVSCDSATFARDARLLADAGYLLEWVQPVDQFPQTPHVETVSRFVRS
ncbi:MAG: class I SAM-dependent RNA methyltransferase [Acidimicrobiia bacterium]